MLYENPPESNIVQGIWRVNRYVAASLKCRIALTMKDWEIARDAARLVMDSRQYSLYPDFGALFRDKTMDNGEYIFCIANSIELGQSSSVNPIHAAHNREQRSRRLPVMGPPCRL